MGLGEASGAWLQLGQAKNFCHTLPPSAHSRQDLGMPVNDSHAIPPSGLRSHRGQSGAPSLVLLAHCLSFTGDYIIFICCCFYFLFFNFGITCVCNWTDSQQWSYLPLCPYPQHRARSECLVSVNKLNLTELFQICGLRVYGIQNLFWTWLSAS